MAFSPLRFAAIYVGILAVLAVIGGAMAYFGFDAPTAMGVISVMIAAMAETQLAAKGLFEKPGGLWRLAVFMAAIAFCVSLVLTGVLAVLAPIDPEIFTILGPTGWIVAALVMFLLSVLMARLGIGFGVKSALAEKTARK